MRRALSAAGTGLTVPLHNFIESYIVRTDILAKLSYQPYRR
jgi:hypothetical protein